ncbi:hypothetical protein NQ317_017629 [Molorchus minor]|uniref:Uncharacterized protein n=1 Tax=Molorchus minor TaxID=1323400 RepID=A0ABQ9IXB2_9CUCU|nr:hypothetical protein NQ317_017629 [Molorchus minor]
MAKLIGKITPLVSKLAEQGRPKLQTFLKYAKVELTPPSPADIPQIRAGIGRLIKRSQKWLLEKYNSERCLVEHPRCR